MEQSGKDKVASEDFPEEMISETRCKGWESVSPTKNSKEKFSGQQQ